MLLDFIFHVVVCTFHVVKYIYHVVECTYHDVEYKREKDENGLLVVFAPLCYWLRVGSCSILSQMSKMCVELAVVVPKI